ncbi:heterokaryon incompatibility protein-domain-containing protein [Cladorrhinum sp. PSN332]|nr:heterokaryon incompatibility protein-domain-containing protein [Cladorrhinum sp. PSN332]
MLDEEITWALVREWPLCTDCDSRIEEFLTAGSARRVKFEYDEFVEAWEETECMLCEAILEACDHLLAQNPLVEPGGKSQRFVSLEMSDEDGNLTPEVISFMKTQLSACLSDPSHAKCRPDPGFGVEWPARLLKITRDQVVLVDFQDPMMGSFAALSYCWGSKEEHERNTPLQLNASTKTSLRAGLPTSKLPLTLRQAVMVSRHLDIEYIWIDALCIIQDESSDWMAEAKKMATVYNMAKITIIATGASSSYDGFLKQNLNSAHLESAFHQPIQLVAQMYCTSGFHANRRLHLPQSDPIDSRGWTYQEELLSTRMLRFTKEDVQWQCNSHSTCVCSQPIWKEESYYIESNKPDWCDLMPHFSSRDFTFAVDRLPALSGLARKYAYEHRLPGKELVYVAGNWQHQLLPATQCSMLAWKTIPFLNPQCYDVYVAPSFSWASIKGYVVFDATMPTVILSEILDVGTTLASTCTDPFGRISEGFLTLRGPVISCFVSIKEKESAKSRWHERIAVELPQDAEIRIRSCLWDSPICQGLGANRGAFLHRSTEPHAALSSFGETDAQILLVSYGEHKREGLQFVGLVLGREPNGKRHQRLAFVTLESLHESIDVERLKRFDEVATIA